MNTITAHSIVEQRGGVTFPEHTGERIYMAPFTQREGLPSALSRWQSTVDAMLKGIQVDGPIYLMVDQGHVRAGTSHRRPGVHIDGYWHPAIETHGGNSGGYGSASFDIHSYRPSGHGARTDRHTYAPSGHGSGGGRRHGMAAGWDGVDFSAPEALILASDVQACRAYAGTYTGVLGEGGDCSRIDVSDLRRIPMRANAVYAGNVSMLHESLPVDRDCLRTLVRLNVPGWTPFSV